MSKKAIRHMGGDWNELVVSGSDGGDLVVSHNYKPGTNLVRNTADPISIEIHPDGYQASDHHTILITFDEAVAIFEHIKVLFNQHDEKGDFDE